MTTTMPPSIRERIEKEWNKYSRREECTPDVKTVIDTSADWWFSTLSETLEELRGEIEKMNKEVGGDGNVQWDLGYEQACSDISTLIDKYVGDINK